MIGRWRSYRVTKPVPLSLPHTRAPIALVILNNAWPAGSIMRARGVTMPRTLTAISFLLITLFALEAELGLAAGATKTELEKTIE